MNATATLIGLFARGALKPAEARKVTAVAETLAGWHSAYKTLQLNGGRRELAFSADVISLGLNLAMALAQGDQPDPLMSNMKQISDMIKQLDVAIRELNEKVNFLTEVSLINFGQIKDSLLRIERSNAAYFREILAEFQQDRVNGIRNEYLASEGNLRALVRDCLRLDRKRQECDSEFENVISAIGTGPYKGFNLNNEPASTSEALSVLSYPIVLGGGTSSRKLRSVFDHKTLQIRTFSASTRSA